MKTAAVKTIAVNIWIAGDASTIERVLREYCFNVGLCVTVTHVKYIYTGGEEGGVVIGLRNYPRFPSDTETLMGRAIDIAGKLMKAACQWSAMVEGPSDTVWLTCRPESGEGANG